MFKEVFSMQKNLFKKYMSVALSVLMLLSCWVWAAPAEADAITDTVASHTDEDNNGYCDSCDELICEHAETETVGENPATCEFDGYTGDKVCVKCGLTVEKGSAVAAYGHRFGSAPVQTVEATCKNGRTLVYKCKSCSYTYSEVVSGYGPHRIVVVEDTAPTCDKPGYYVHFCLTCDTSVQVIETEPTGHVDENSDGACDVFGCGAVVETARSTKCSCICHNDNPFMQFIYKLVSTFWKLLGISQVCDCSAVHY